MCSIIEEMTSLKPSTINGSTLCITWSKMTALPCTLCVTHCSARLNIQSSCILTSADIDLTHSFSMKGIQKRPVNSWSTWSKVILPVGNKNDCWKKESEQSRSHWLLPRQHQPWRTLRKLPLPPRRRRKPPPHRHLQMIFPKGIQKLRRRVKQLPFFLHHLRSLMPTRRTRKARGREEDRRHPLTRRRFSVATSSTKVDVTKVTNVFAVIPRKSMMQEWKTRREGAEVEIRQEGKVREVLRLLDQRRRPVGNGRNEPAHLEANANSYM